MKLALLVLAVSISCAAGDGSGGGSNTDCESVKAGKSEQPQMKGKTCDQVTKNDCKFIHDAIHCCDSCKDPDSVTKAPDRSNDQPKKKKKKGCFSGNDIVQTKEYGRITMGELAEKRDAHVLARNDDGQLEYSPVRYWLHAKQSVSMKFLILRTESGHRLPITSDHLIYQTECRGGPGAAIYAKNVQVGRCLYVNENGDLKETPVVEKGEEKITGVYSPITETGSIVVNDVLASCYNNYENEPLQKFVYQLMIGFQDALANLVPASIYEAAFNRQDGDVVTVPRLIFSFLQLSNYFVH